MCIAVNLISNEELNEIKLKFVDDYCILVSQTKNCNMKTQLLFYQIKKMNSMKLPSVVKKLIQPTVFSKLHSK